MGVRVRPSLIFIPPGLIRMRANGARAEVRWPIAVSIHRTRREFLADVGRGALIASVGFGLAKELRFGVAFAEAEPEALSFGPLEPLVALMQETSAERILPVLVERLKVGTDLRTLVAAAALANARTFGGEDYVGFHTMMALGPAFHMAEESPEKRRALPVLKVLYRNTSRIQELGGRANEVLRVVLPSKLPTDRNAGEAIRDAVRAKDATTAERAFAALGQGSADESLNAVLYAVEDHAEVHRVNMPYRAWELSSVIGTEHAHTLLRQAVRYCVKEEFRSGSARGNVRALLPRLLDDHRLLDRTPGAKPADDAWIEATSRAIFEATPEGAAEIAAAALSDGRAPDAVGEVISLAANQLVLRDAGRAKHDERPGKPIGSVHGDSIGVHASDSASAWRRMALVGTPRNAFACLILGAYQVALDRVNRGGDFLAWKAQPLAEDLANVTATDADTLLREADAAIRAKDQRRACAIVDRCGRLDVPPRRVFDLLLGYAASEDGALHAEKYYRTVNEEFATTRPAFRWRHLLALARVTASESGQRAAGFDEACALLGI